MSPFVIMLICFGVMVITLVFVIFISIITETVSSFFRSSSREGDSLTEEAASLLRSNSRNVVGGDPFSIDYVTRDPITFRDSRPIRRPMIPPTNVTIDGGSRENLPTVSGLLEEFYRREPQMAPMRRFTNEGLMPANLMNGEAVAKVESKSEEKVEEAEKPEEPEEPENLTIGG